MLAQSNGAGLRRFSAGRGIRPRAKKESFMTSLLTFKSHYGQRYCFALVLGAISFFQCGVTAMAQTSAPAVSTTKWKLTWSDEFNGADGSLPDAAKWEMQTGGKGWGNNELETYTTRAVNAAQ